MLAIARLRQFSHLDSASQRAWLGIAVLFIIGVAASAVAGGAVGALTLLALSALVLVSARRATADESRAFVVGLVAFAFVARALLAAGLHIYLAAHLRAGGALFSDDAIYLDVASQLGQSWRGGPAVGLDPSLNNNYVRFAGALFAAFGPNPIVLKLVNTAFGVLAAVVVYRTMVNLRLPGPRIGLLLMLVFPSLVLWSALALKDAYALFFAVAPIWLMSEYARTRRFVPWYFLLVGSLLAIENVRSYLFVILVVAWPICTPFVLAGARWLRPTAAAASLAAVLLAATPALTVVNPNFVSASEYIRRTMATGARSGFVEPIPIGHGNPGDRFEVTAVGQTPIPLRERRLVEIQPGDNLVLEGAAAGSQPDPKAKVVRPGDVVVIGRAGGGPVAPVPLAAAPPPSARPTATPVPIVLATVGRNIVENATAAPISAGSGDSLTPPSSTLEGLRYLPLGIAYLVSAPFPLSATSVGDLATIPEMLLLYVCEILAVWGMVLLVRRHRLEFAYGVLAMAAIGLVLSLYEGNAGTLLRHRGMLIPFIVVLSAVGAVALLTRLERFALVRVLVGR